MLDIICELLIYEMVYNVVIQYASSAKRRADSESISNVHRNIQLIRIDMNDILVRIILIESWNIDTETNGSTFHAIRWIMCVEVLILVFLHECGHKCKGLQWHSISPKSKLGTHQLILKNNL